METPEWLCLAAPRASLAAGGPCLCSAHRVQDPLSLEQP
jgi:hypothetical protein